MLKDEFPSTLKNLEEMQKKLCLLIESVQAHSKVTAFMKSPVGQYLDRHPFLTLALLIFVAVSAIPVGFFLFLVVLTSLAAFVGVILLEGLVISVGGLSLLCVLCGLCFVSFVLSGTVIMSYLVTSSFINYWFSPKSSVQQKFGDSNQPQQLGHRKFRREPSEVSARGHQSCSPRTQGDCWVFPAPAESDSYRGRPNQHPLEASTPLPPS